MRVSVEFEWDHIGNVTMSCSGKLAFPSMPAGPGVYRFQIQVDGGVEVYIGESENLLQRMEHNYRYHPATTNARVREMLLSHVSNGRTVTLALLQVSSIEVGGVDSRPDFNHKSMRLLAENAALAAARAAGDHIHNL